MSAKKSKKEGVGLNVLHQFQANLITAIDCFAADKDNPAPPPLRKKGRAAWLARLVGDVSYVATNKWLLGNGMPSRDKQELLAKKLNVRIQWLFFNLGPMREPSVGPLMIAVNNALKKAGLTLTATQKSKLISALHEEVQRLS